MSIANSTHRSWKWIPSASLLKVCDQVHSLPLHRHRPPLPSKRPHLWTVLYWFHVRLHLPPSLHPLGSPPGPTPIFPTNRFQVILHLTYLRCWRVRVPQWWIHVLSMCQQIFSSPSGVQPGMIHTPRGRPTPVLMKIMRHPLAPSRPIPSQTLQWLWTPLHSPLPPLW